MQHPDEGMIHTWLDGELPADEAAALEAHVAECAECRAAVAEARGFIAASSRIVGALDNVPAGVIPIAKPARRVWYSSPQFRAAAAVLVVAVASLLVMRTGTQKATLSDTVRPEASEVTTQRVMAAADAAPVMDSAAVTSPTVNRAAVSRQSAANEQAVAPLARLPKSSQVVNPVMAPDMAKPSPVEPKVLNQADFSGKGVKGGIANGVASGLPLRGRVAGVAPTTSGGISAFDVPALPPRVIRADSSVLGKRTTYQTASGKEIVLTEQRAESQLSEVVVTGVAVSTDASRKAAPKSSSRPQSSQAPAPVAAAAPQVPAPPPPAIEADSLAVHTISWLDTATQRRYTLSGPISVAELYVIKAQLIQAKH